MLEALSCLRVDWDAISAVATASACVIALCVATRDGRHQRHKQRQILERVRILSQLDIVLLDAFYETVVLLGKQPEPFSATEHELATMRKLMAVPNLRASLEEAEHLPNALLKAISDVLKVLDGHEVLLMAAIIGGEDSTFFNKHDGLRMAIDNLKAALEKIPQ